MTKRMWIGLAAAVLMAAMLAAQKPEAADTLLQTAIKREMVDGNLAAAIEGYKKALAAANGNRVVAAMALVHMAQCHQKMGDADARKLYEQVVREYGDQKEAVTLARARLGKETPNNRSLAFRRIWKLPPGATIEGTSSRDGRYLPYVDWAQHGDLFLHDFVTGHDRRLTNTATGGMGSPQVEQFAEESTLSPDGRQLAYSWYREDLGYRYELRMMDLKGDGIPQSRFLFENPDIAWISPDDWSPDGKWIAVRIQRNDKIIQIGLVSVAEGSLRVLKTLDWRGTSRPFFSPDGRYLGYDRAASDTSPQRDVFVIAIDGSREIPAVAHRADDIMMGWSPDSKRLLFGSDRLGSMDLWSLPFADGTLQGEPELVKSDIGRAKPVGVTEGGAFHLAIFTGASHLSNIQVASFDFDNWTLLSKPVDVSQDYLESNVLPEWSPDGKYLGYISVRGRVPAANTILVIRSAETRQLIRELPVKLTDVYWSRWAPDGRSFMLGGRDSKGGWGIFQMDAQTGGITPVIVDAAVRYPMWSRDGKSIYFSRQIPGTQERALIVRDLASGNEKELLRRSSVVPNRISPDGRYFTADAVDMASGSSAKLLIPIEGGEPREMMRISWGADPESLANFGSKGIELRGGHWAPDGQSFFVTKYFHDGHDNEIWRVPVDGSAPKKVSVGGFAQPGGKQIVIPTREKGPPQGAELWVLENFLPTTTRASR